jgi:hypothetical protein
MNYDNPAARLLTILEKGRKCTPTTNCRAVWDELLQAQGNSAVLMARLGKLMELPQLAILALKEEFPEQGDTWSHWESQVSAGFMVQNMHANWDSFISHIDDHTLRYLAMASSLLQAKANTKQIAEADLVSVRETLDAILVEVMSTELPGEVKRYLVRNLRNIVTSIDEYRLTGALPLLDAVETTLGHAAVDMQYRSFLSDTELGKRLLETLGSMANVVTVAVGLPQLTQAIALLGN